MYLSYTIKRYLIDLILLALFSSLCYMFVSTRLAHSFSFAGDVQNPLETRMRLGRLLNGCSRVATAYRSQYDITDLDLHSYILSTDAEAWHRYMCGIEVCPFCGTERTLAGSCCKRFSQFRQAAGLKLRGGQEDEKSKDGKSGRRNLNFAEQAKWKTTEIRFVKQILRMHNSFEPVLCV